MSLISKVKTFLFNLNEKGIPVPLLRDPNTDSPSVTMTMMVTAFAIAAAGLIGKFTKVLGEVDVSGANYLFLTAAGLYLGRRMSSENGKKVEVSNKEDETKE